MQLWYDNKKKFLFDKLEAVEAELAKRLIDDNSIIIQRVFSKLLLLFKIKKKYFTNIKKKI